MLFWTARDELCACLILARRLHRAIAFVPHLSLFLLVLFCDCRGGSPLRLLVRPATRHALRQVRPSTAAALATLTRAAPSQCAERASASTAPQRSAAADAFAELRAALVRSPPL